MNLSSKQRAYLKSLAMTMDPIFQFGKNQLRRHDKHRCQNAALIKAAAKGKTDNCTGPQAGSRRKSLDALSAGDNNCTCADKTNTGNYLRAQTRHIGKIMHI